MPLRFDMEEWLGTNLDGSKSDTFCYYCLKDGKYTVDVSMHEMIDIWLKYIRWVLSIPFFISCIRQQNPLTVLSKIILRKVKQFNLPPPKKK